MPFQAVLMNIPNSKVCLKGESSIQLADIEHVFLLCYLHDSLMNFINAFNTLCNLKLQALANIVLDCKLLAFGDFVCMYHF